MLACLRSGLLALVVSVLTLQCGGKEMAKYSQLDRLRILALVVDTPELQNPAAGVTNVQLTPILSDIGGTGTIDLAVQSCLDPGSSLGADPSCDGAAQASTVQNITVSDAGGAPVDTFGDPERTGQPASGAIAVPLNIPAGLLSAYSATIQNNGLPYLITVTATRGSQTLKSFKRVLISNKAPNTNPTLSDLLSNGVSLTALPTGKPALSFTSSGAETYPFMNSAGATTTETEVFETTWFVADGVIENSRTRVGETTEWEAPATAPAGRQAVVVGVLRDDRGGTAVLIRKF